MKYCIDCIDSIEFKVQEIYTRNLYFISSSKVLSSNWQASSRKRTMMEVILLLTILQILTTKVLQFFSVKRRMRVKVYFFSDLKYLDEYIQIRNLIIICRLRISRNMNA